MAKAVWKAHTLLSPLPSILTMESGDRVRTPADWEIRRREMLRLAVGMQYGGMPPEPEFLEVELLYASDRFSSYRIHTGRRAVGITFVMQIVWPKQKRERYPVIVDGDGCFPYVYNEEVLALILEEGVALARFNRVELAHDIRESVHTDGLYGVYPGMTFSALAAWAWGYHRCVDALLQLDIADASLIAFTGHSRGGKTALLAGVTDPRAAIVNPNGSGAGGTGCYRVHTTTLCEDGVERRSEELRDLIRNFPHWFGPEMPEYAEKEGELPFDEHFLKALVAPRILLDTEALSDAWANPLGAFVTHQAAREAYRFLGAENNCLIHYRDGYHSHTPADFSVLLHVIRHLRDGEELDNTLNRPPFDEMPQTL